MANLEHVGILKHGGLAWNEWRGENPEISPDLRGANLVGADLSGTSLSQTDLSGAILELANLDRANLQGANLIGAKLGSADLKQADLSRANLSWADLSQTDLSEANLSRASLNEADLRWSSLNEATLIQADLTDTDLRAANLRGANLDSAVLVSANLSGALMDNVRLPGAIAGDTVFAEVDLSTAKGLETCHHIGPSVIDHRTLVKSVHLPLAFLRGCGLPDAIIDVLPSLHTRAVPFRSCFISCARNDEDFVRRLHADLQDKGIRCWFAPPDLRMEERTRHQVEESIRIHDKLLLVLSAHSIENGWMMSEAERALAEERQQGRSILLPIRLDDAAMKADCSWMIQIGDRRVCDFRNWNDHAPYQRGFEQLMRELTAEGG